MQLRSHEINARGSDDCEDRFDIRAGATGIEAGDLILTLAARRGLEFDPSLAGTPLHHGAEWTTGWNGPVLQCTAIQGGPDASANVSDLSGAVCQATAPTLGSRRSG